jgi:hypothetical protein
LSNLKTILYDRQWILGGIFSIIINNNKLNILEELRKKLIVKENYYLFQNYKDFNII